MSSRARTKSDPWLAARKALRAADPRMAALVDANPTLDPDAVLGDWASDVWSALVFGVLSQQLSTASAMAIGRRLEAIHDGRLPTPAEMLELDAPTLRGLGLSWAKAGYLRDLAERLVDGRLDLQRLNMLDDDAAREELTTVKGVGRFTADGVLMFALHRPDVWPAADLAIRRAVGRIWAMDPLPSIAEVDAIGEPFRPWRTLAALYLYRSQAPPA